MNPRHLIPQALTETAFAPYGQVLQVPADGHGGQSIIAARSSGRL